MVRKNPHLHELCNRGTYYDSVKFRMNDVIQRHHASNPEQHLSIMAWGDPGLPLPPCVVQKLLGVVEMLGKQGTCSSYEDIRGILELRSAICEKYYHAILNIPITPDEVFVNDGAQSAITGLMELFSPDSIVAFQNPHYPTAFEGALLLGRQFRELPCLEECDFVPRPPQEKVDIIFLCSPNNPTGATLSRSQLQEFVDYARAHSCVIIFDAVYSLFAQDSDIPLSIFELDGALECAIEISSFSKFANLAGLRVGWTTIPSQLRVANSQIGEMQAMWNIRNSVRFWGASNLAQHAAIAALSEQGQIECREIVKYYMENVGLLRQVIESCGMQCFGGTHNPYLWVRAPGKRLSSWQLFEYLMQRWGIVGIPGILFGSQGEGYVRLCALGQRQEIQAIHQHYHKAG